MKAILVLLAFAVFAFADAFNDGAAAANRSDRQEAVKQSTQAIKIVPNDAKAYYNRGNSYFELGDYSKAIEYYTKAIEIDPNHVDAYNNRGNSYGKLYNYKKATKDARKACDLGNCKVLKWLGENHKIDD
ncbi:hypothetical protein AGMMS50229_10300 [Campylobacterota bacterium]|nr:hypothetical protein AGMMS50229_10300 [Campylobacterota bacterium]